LGCKEGSNLRIDERWGVADTEVNRASAVELLQLKPDAIVVQGAQVVELVSSTICWL
jgi:hypothetical protein